MEPEKVDVKMEDLQSTKGEQYGKMPEEEVQERHKQKLESVQRVGNSQMKKNLLISNQNQNLSAQNNQQNVNAEKKSDQVRDTNQQKQITQKQIIQQISIDTSNIALQRPITINLGTDAIQMEKSSNILDKEPQIKIEVVDSVDKGFALNRQTFFKIVGFDKHGPIEIFRRFEEFQSLRRILLQRWPGCFVTHLSLKSEIKSEHYRNLHKWNNLKQFLIKLTWFEEIYYKEEVQLFLRCIGIDIQEMFTQMPTLRVKDVIQRFKSSYGDEGEKVTSAQNSTYISNFSTSLKKVSNNLSNLSKKMLKLAEAYQNYQTALPKFSNFLMRYQQVCLSEYTNDPNTSIAHKDSNEKLNKLKIIQEKGNIFYDFYFLLESENRDADALLEVILAMQMFTIKRDQLQQTSKQIREQIDQISLGHKNIKVMTSRKPKQQIQKELEQRQKRIIGDKHSVLELAGISEVILATVSIPTFRKMKINNYFKIIKKWVDTVGQLNTDVYEVWKYLQEQGDKQLKNISS